MPNVGAAAPLALPSLLLLGHERRILSLYQAVWARHYLGAGDGRWGVGETA